MVNNRFLTVILGDFNAKSSLWYNNDVTTYEGSKIHGITSQFELQQIIKEPTFFLGDASACIDLIFTTHPNLVMKSGVHSSLHANCHHHIAFAKFNFKMHYVPPYDQDVWRYQKTNVDQIRQAISAFHWNNHLANINVNEQVQFLLKQFKI